MKCLALNGVLVFCFFASCGCADQKIYLPSSRIHSPEKRASSASQQSEKSESSKNTISEWRFVGLIYQDRNGDGIIDWMEQGYEGVLDAPGFSREDVDFDGIFDKVIGSEGLTGNYEKKIDIPVPPIHKTRRPTRKFQGNATTAGEDFR